MSDARERAEKAYLDRHTADVASDHDLWLLRRGYMRGWNEAREVTYDTVVANREQFQAFVDEQREPLEYYRGMVSGLTVALQLIDRERYERKSLEAAEKARWLDDKATTSYNQDTKGVSSHDDIQSHGPRLGNPGILPR